MSERVRRSGVREAQSLPSIRPGIEGFADGMRIFPRLKEWENQIALQALREGKTVEDLRNITSFRQYLGAEKRAYLAGEGSPFSSFTSLFAMSPSIDMLASFGNFHTIRTWTWTLAKQHPKLNLPLEHFYQDALYHIVPSQAKSYDPSFGRTFTGYVVSMLKMRFRDFVQDHKRDYTTPVSYEEKQASKYGRHAASKTRVSLVSVDAPMPHVEIPQTYLEYFETTHLTPQDTTQAEDQEVKDKIHLLSQLAGLTKPQEETLIALYVYGGNTTLISQLRRSTARIVRKHRQDALSKLQELGRDTVNGVLNGEYPTLDAALASCQETPAMR